MSLKKLLKFLNELIDALDTKPVAIYFAGFIALLVLGMAGALVYLGMNNTVPVLEPRGLIALKEKNLLAFASTLSLVVIIPVYTLLLLIVWRYREKNKKSKKRYRPDWNGSKALELTWWGIPLAIIAVLSVVTWFSSHDLDPYKALESENKPVTVQVVAMQWKWLFIYPEHNIATVNYFQIPEDTPINFEITADAPMNSFWLPQLGGQVYAMSGMTTKLHLVAEEQGVYTGSSANISGSGFADMRFSAEAVSQKEFEDWVLKTNTSGSHLDLEEYKRLAQPGTSPVTLYALAQQDLHGTIIMKHMDPGSPLKDGDERTEELNHGGSGH